MDPTLAQRLDGVCNRFEAAWRVGPPRLEEYLAGWEGAERQLLLRELVQLDLHYRQKHGLPARMEDYLARFPELSHAEATAAFETRPTEATQNFEEEIPASSPPQTASARKVGEYEILGEIARGGMGVVYRARHPRLNRQCAVKMILAGGHAGETERQRFEIEAQAIARLQHPGIVQVFEIGEQEGKPFLALEFCSGGSLEEHLRNRPPTAAEAARIVLQLARAMQAAHEAQVIHRDLKPANVLLTGEGQFKITDFGLARKLDEVGQTHTGAVMGTPSYMAPEQARGEKILGPGVDVYALGGILYSALTGRPPFRGATVVDTIRQVQEKDPVFIRQLNPDIPRDLETICHHCLQKDPGRRYPSAQALAEDLERFLADRPILARPTSPIERVVKWVRRNPIPTLLTAAVVFVGLSGLGAVLWQMEATRSEANARAEALQDKVNAEETAQAALKDKLQVAEQLLRTEAEKGEALRRQFTAEQKERLALAAREAGDYATFLSGAGLAIQAKNLPLARALLGRCPENRRDLGWHHLAHCTAETAVQLSLPGIQRADFLGDGGHVLVFRRAEQNPDNPVQRDRVSVWAPEERIRLREWESRSGTRFHALSDRRDRLATITSNELQFLEVGKGKLLNTIRLNVSGVRGLTFLPGAQQVAVYCTTPNSQFLQIWEVASGKPIRTIPLPQDGRRGFFSPDGSTFRLLAKTGAVQRLESYPLTAAEAGADKPGRQPILGDVRELSPDGSHAVSIDPVPPRGQEVRVIQVTTGKVLARWPIPPETGIAAQPAFHPRKPLIAFGHEKQTLLANYATGRVERTFDYPGEPTSSVRFNDEGTALLATQQSGCRVWFLRKQSFAPVHTAAFPPGTANARQVHPEGTHFLNLGFTFNRANIPSALVSFATGQALLDEVDSLQFLEFSRDGKRVLLARNTAFSVYDFPSMKPVYQIERTAAGGFIPLTPGALGLAGSHLILTQQKAVSATERTVELRVLQLPEGKPLVESRLFLRMGKMTTVTWSVRPQGDRVLFHRMQTEGLQIHERVEEHTLATGEVRVLIERQSPGGRLHEPGYSPGGMQIVCFEADRADMQTPGKLRVWDAITGKEVYHLDSAPESWRTGIVFPQFSPDGMWMAGSQLEAGKTCLIEAATGKIRLTLPGILANQQLPAFRSDGKAIVVLDQLSGTDISIHEVPGGKRLQTLAKHRECNMVGFARHSPHLLSNDHDRAEKITRQFVWNAEDGTRIRELTWKNPSPGSEYGLEEKSTEHKAEVRAYSMESRTPQWSLTFTANLPPPETLHVVAEFDPLRQRVALADQRGRDVLVCEHTTGKVQQQRQTVLPADITLHRFRFDARRNRLYLLGISRKSEGFLMEWDLESDHVRSFPRCPSRLVDLVLLPDSDQLLGITNVGTVAIWDRKTLASQGFFEGKPQESWGRVPQLSRDGRYLALTAPDRPEAAFLIWETTTGRQLVLEGTEGLKAGAGCFHPDSQQVCLAFQDAEQQTGFLIWNLPDGKIRQRIIGLNGPPLALALPHSGNRLLVLGRKEISLWDHAEGRSVLTFTPPASEILAAHWLEPSGTLVQITRDEVTRFDCSQREIDRD